MHGTCLQHLVEPLQQAALCKRGNHVLQRTTDGGLTWDVRLQGEGETVFLDFQ